MPARAGDEKSATHEARLPIVATPAAMTDFAFQGASARKAAQIPCDGDSCGCSRSSSMRRLALIAREGVAGLRVARLQSFAEPGHALFRGAVRPALWLDIALSHLLEPVVSYGGSGFQAFLEIARLDGVSSTLGVVAPDTGETVSLKFHSHC